jgi:hypothetical protein
MVRSLVNCLLLCWSDVHLRIAGQMKPQAGAARKGQMRRVLSGIGRASNPKPEGRNPRFWCLSQVLPTVVSSLNGAPTLPWECRLSRINAVEETAKRAKYAKTKARLRFLASALASPQGDETESLTISLLVAGALRCSFRVFRGFRGSIES